MTTILDLVTAEGWDKEIIAEGVRVKNRTTGVRYNFFFFGGGGLTFGILWLVFIFFNALVKSQHFYIDFLTIDNALI